MLPRVILTVIDQSCSLYPGPHQVSLQAQQPHLGVDYVGDGVDLVLLGAQTQGGAYPCGQQTSWEGEWLVGLQVDILISCYRSLSDNYLIQSLWTMYF